MLHAPNLLGSNPLPIPSRYHQNCPAATSTSHQSWPSWHTPSPLAFKVAPMKEKWTSDQTECQFQMGVCHLTLAPFVAEPECRLTGRTPETQALRCPASNFHFKPRSLHYRRESNTKITCIIISSRLLKRRASNFQRSFRILRDFRSAKFENNEGNNQFCFRCRTSLPHYQYTGNISKDVVIFFSGHHC